MSGIFKNSPFLMIRIKHTKVKNLTMFKCLGAGNGRLIGGATSGVVFILIILGLAVWFTKYKKTHIGKKIQLYSFKF